MLKDSEHNSTEYPRRTGEKYFARKHIVKFFHSKTIKYATHSLENDTEPTRIALLLTILS